MKQNIKLQTTKPEEIMYIRLTTTPTNIANDVPAAYNELLEYLQSVGALLTGKTYNIFQNIDPDAGTADLECAFVVLTQVPPTGRIRGRTLDETLAAIMIHRGPYEEMEGAAKHLSEWLRENGYVATGEMRESYLNQTDNPDQALTEITWPVEKRDY